MEKPLNLHLGYGWLYDNRETKQKLFLFRVFSVYSLYFQLKKANDIRVKTVRGKMSTSLISGWILISQFKFSKHLICLCFFFSSHFRARHWRASGYWNFKIEKPGVNVAHTSCLCFDFIEGKKKLTHFHRLVSNHPTFIVHILLVTCCWWVLILQILARDCRFCRNKYHKYTYTKKKTKFEFHHHIRKGSDLNI